MQFHVHLISFKFYILAQCNLFSYHLHSTGLNAICASHIIYLHFTVIGSMQFVSYNLHLMQFVYLISFIGSMQFVHLISFKFYSYWLNAICTSHIIYILQLLAQCNLCISYHLHFTVIGSMQLLTWWLMHLKIKL